MGSFVSLLMYLDLYEKGRANGNNASGVAPSISGFISDKLSATARKITVEKHEAPKQDGNAGQKNTAFDFYSLLPKMEVLVPESELSQSPAKISEKEKNRDLDKQTQSLTTSHALSQGTAGKGNYFLQAGAFKDMQAADRMKANLGLLGIESRIESVTLDSGMWHRVRIGPFADLQQLNKTRNIMKSNRISAITVKVNS